MVKRSKTTNGRVTEFPMFQRVISPLTSADFFKNIWETKYVHIPSEKVNISNKFGFDFKLDDLWKTIESSEWKLKYQEHLNVCSCNDGEVQKMHNLLDEDVKVSDLKKLWDNDKTTFQFFHPQCYRDDIFAVLNELENEFDCLWGANVYLTPKGSQGLAPHFDDADVFVVQTEGVKCWRLFENLAEGEKLAQFSSLPLPKEGIGRLLAEIVLQEGDVLYLPRGTIHCARADEKVHSVHVTISTYQRNSICNLATELVPTLLEDLIPRDVEFRKGLPVGFRSHPEKSVEIIKRQLAKSLRKLADCLDGSSKLKDDVEAFDEFVKQGVDIYTSDFFESRLPPPENSKERIKFVGSFPKSIIKTGDEIRLINPKWVHFVILDQGDVESSESEEGTEEEEEKVEAPQRLFLKIYNILTNHRENHMGLNSSEQTAEDGGEEIEPKYISVDIDETCADFVAELRSSFPRFLKVSNDLVNFANVLNEANVLTRRQEAQD